METIQPGFEAPDAWGAITMIAAGAIFWTIHTRAESAWVSGFRRNGTSRDDGDDLRCDGWS